MKLMSARVAQSPARARRFDLHVPSRRTCRIDATGYMVLPGLINAHDHLEFNLYPRLGNGPYPNSKAWADDIYAPDRDPIRRHLRVPKSVRLLWGGLKNLLCGVTTVCHHNRRNHPAFDDDFPVRVVRRFGWAHSLDFSPDLRRRFRETPKSWPFILHLGEATDRPGSDEIFRLDSLGALDHRTILVHAVALDRKGLSLVRKNSASLIWCPSSNLFVLGRTLQPSVLRSRLPVALGSDSALTAEGDLLDELRVGSSSVDCATLYRMVTDVPRRLLRLSHCSGDLALFRDVSGDPAETLSAAGPPDLVIVRGRIRLVSAGFADRLPHAMTRQMHSFRVDGREMLCDLDVGRLWHDTAAILGADFRLAGKRISP